MSVFYFIFCLVAFLMQLIVLLWLGRFFFILGIKGPLLTALIGTVVMFAGFTFTRTHQTGLFWHALYYISYTYFGLTFLAFCFCTAFAVLHKVLSWCRVPADWMGLATLITLAIVFGLAFWGGFSSPKVKHIPVQIPGAPRLKLALLADTHLGMGVSLARFDKVLQKIEAENPDALLVLGDIFEYGPHRERYAKRLAQVKTPLGSYGVLGNHEYYVGYGDSKDFFNQGGITLLENTFTTLPNGVQIAGLKDIKTARVTAKEVETFLNTLDKNKPTILLSHTPLYAEVAAACGADLMLSGHTHNGQLWPFNYLVKLQFPRIYGLYKVGEMPFYITSGVFYWGVPLRFLSPAEIVIVEVNA